MRLLRHDDVSIPLSASHLCWISCYQLWCPGNPSLAAQDKDNHGGRCDCGKSDAEPLHMCERLLAKAHERPSHRAADYLPSTNTERGPQAWRARVLSGWTPLLERESRSGSSPHDFATDATDGDATNLFYIVTITIDPFVRPRSDRNRVQI